MGKLAMWGAVGGVAKGMQANIEMEQKKEMMNLDEARTRRILQMQQEFQAGQQTDRQAHAEKMQDTQITAQKEMQGAGFEHAEEMQGAQQEFQAGMQDDEQEFTGAENDKNRATTLEAARVRASASGSKKGRWSFSKMKETRPGVDGGLPGEFEVPVLRDGATGRQYIQRGDRFMLPEMEPGSVRRAARSEVQKLLKGEISADVFVNAYKYLPIEAFNQLNATGTETDSEED